MMNRVCPNCSKPLKESDLYFCLSCGQKLDEGLIKGKHPFTPKIIAFTPTEKGEGRKFINLTSIKLHKKLIVGLFFIVLAAGVSVWAIFLTLSRAKRVQELTASPQIEEVVEITSFPNSKDLDLPQQNINLADDDYTKYIPYGNYVYVLGADVFDYYTRFFGLITEDSLLSGLHDYVEGKFIVIGSKEEGRWYMTAILYLQDDKSADEDFVWVSKEGWSVGKVGDVLVLSEKRDIVEAVSESSLGNAKNISHHPQYRTSQTQIPEEGQLLYVDLSNQDNTLRELIEVYSPVRSLVDKIKDIYSGDPDKFVIRNNNE